MLDTVVVSTVVIPLVQELGKGIAINAPVISEISKLHGNRRVGSRRQWLEFRKGIYKA